MGCGASKQLAPHLWRFANACTGRVRYGTGSGSDLAPP